MSVQKTRYSVDPCYVIPGTRARHLVHNEEVTVHSMKFRQVLVNDAREDGDVGCVVAMCVRSGSMCWRALA